MCFIFEEKEKQEESVSNLRVNEGKPAIVPGGNGDGSWWPLESNSLFALDKDIQLIHHGIVITLKR